MVMRDRMADSPLRGYRLAILLAAARDQGQACDAYGTCEAAKAAAAWLIEQRMIEVRGERWYATPNGAVIAFVHKLPAS